ncbi:glycosyltransferase [Streptomyces sp. BE308]|uniref:tetratricopeptide repeat-containing glycosyltransferase n=1 Tax=Streptomyces sp. BE308 TaxID=3002529 RepID=UPI002E771E93|nr:glycosyltransferase [Streptomyces sp. BE308]MEE1792616.1 glycosyltransferase [Streptomyces sp. BE308]
MIVRNESAVIRRCLESVLPLIDRWVISDTGSTDGTQEIIKEVLAGVPGQLHQDSWVDFGHNRTQNIRRAAGAADYLLLVDADMVIEQRHALPRLTVGAYMVAHAGDMTYRNKRLVRGDLPWRYVGATHEYLEADGEGLPAGLDALVVRHFADGGSRSDKFERDERLLRSDLARDPGNARAVFYLAQTLRDLGRGREAVEWYERRAAMGGWAEEVYYAQLQAGVLRAEAGDWASGMADLVAAWELRPQRMEACYELASRLRVRGQYASARAFARAGLDRPEPGDWLFVQPWVYRWGLLFEYSITAYWTGDYPACVAACDRLLAMEDLPAVYREQTLKNRRFAVDGLFAGAASAVH